MFCLRCCRKTVKFNSTIDIIYYEPTSVETNVNWHQIACDRIRFMKRMYDVERKIGWVFAPSHRDRVYNMLFSL